MRFVGEGELDDDTAYRWVGVCSNDFFSERVDAFGTIIFDANTDIFTVLDFEVDVFFDDRVVAVAEDE